MSSCEWSQVTWTPTNLMWKLLKQAFVYDNEKGME